jgi:cyclic pyranopterin phosphate synthase
MYHRPVARTASTGVETYPLMPGPHPYTHPESDAHTPGQPVAGPGDGAGERAAGPPADRLGRNIRDLRVSVTDRCNFRCRYCMPREVFGRDFQFLPRSELLTFEEIARLAGIFVELGVRKLRLTGGEPLVRRDLHLLVALLARLPGEPDLALTTNGSLLAAQVAALCDAGLRRVTVSLDSLDDDVFMAMNDAAVAAGLAPVKLNMVVKRGVNETSILPMADFARERGHILRYIEYMDVGNTNGWRMTDVVPAAEVVAAVDAVHPLEPVAPQYPGEVANRWRYRDGAGEIGVIASVTRPFCRGCTRARLSAEGQLYTCLFGTQGHDLRAPLRDGATDAELDALIRGIWHRRDDRYSELRTLVTLDRPKVEMSHIGG